MSTVFHDFLPPLPAPQDCPYLFGVSPDDKRQHGNLLGDFGLSPSQYTYTCATTSASSVGVRAAEVELGRYGGRVDGQCWWGTGCQGCGDTDSAILSSGHWSPPLVGPLREGVVKCGASLKGVNIILSPGSSSPQGLSWDKM